MTPLEFGLIAAMSTAAGFIGALLGLGGGIIIVPGLTLLFAQDMKTAIAASLVSVIATSSSAATVYVQENLTNIRLGMLLEIATTVGALVGGAVAIYVNNRYLYLLFAAVMLYAAWTMIRHRDTKKKTGDSEESTNNRLNGEYVDPITGHTVAYTVKAVPVGMVGSLGAGIMSGLLGVGGGIVKVPLMNTAMKVPIRAAIATSNFMIGVTAASGALVFWMDGKVDPVVTAPCVIGVLLGARLGTIAAGKLRTRMLKLAFAVFVLITAYQMVIHGLRGL